MEPADRKYGDLINYFSMHKRNEFMNINIFYFHFTQNGHIETSIVRKWHEYKLSYDQYFTTANDSKVESKLRIVGAVVVAIQ